MVSTRNLDRMLGVFVTLSGGAAVYFLQKWIKTWIKDYLISRKSLKRDEGDELHNQRYSKSNTTLHHGYCHCRRVKFRMRSPKTIRAIDVPSKIRFPRVSIPSQFFEPLSDETFLSFYAVNADSSIGVYTFCSYCGVHILFSPSINPTELMINADCIDRSTVEELTVAFYPIKDSYPITDVETVKAYSKRGSGVVVNSVHASTKPAITPMKSYLHQQQQQQVFSFRESTPPTTATSSSGSSAGSSSSAYRSNMTPTSGNDDVDAFFGMWPLIPAATSKVVDGSSMDNEQESTIPIRKIVSFSPTKPRRRQERTKLVSIDTPMHRQLQIHLQHYLKDGRSAPDE